MLRLISKIGTKQFVEGNSRTYWLFIISEFLLVILGILIALQIDNWNQNRQEKKQETVLLNELLLNLQGDQKDVESNTNSLSTALNSSRIILAHFEENRPYHDSLEYHFGQFFRGTIFNRNLSAYESLKSIGIGLVRNNHLRQQITYLYSVKYDYLLKLEVAHHNVVRELLFPIVAKELNTTGVFQKAIPLNPSEIGDNNVFKESIKRNTIFLNLQISQYQQVNTLIIELINSIEAELGLA
jgi:hypothetical protein